MENVVINCVYQRSVPCHSLHQPLVRIIPNTKYFFFFFQKLSLAKSLFLMESFKEISGQLSGC